jgi:hypothetical protein
MGDRSVSYLTLELSGRLLRSSGLELHHSPARVRRMAGLSRFLILIQSRYLVDWAETRAEARQQDTRDCETTTDLTVMLLTDPMFCVRMLIRHGHQAVGDCLLKLPRVKNGVVLALPVCHRGRRHDGRVWPELVKELKTR